MNVPALKDYMAITTKINSSVILTCEAMVDLFNMFLLTEYPDYDIIASRDDKPISEFNKLYKDLFHHLASCSYSLREYDNLELHCPNYVDSNFYSVWLSIQTFNYKDVFTGKLYLPVLLDRFGTVLINNQ